MVESLHLSETSQVMPPSSAFLSTLLPCNFPQTNPLSSEHSMIFQTQGLNSAIILPKNNILLLIPISVLVFCCCDKTPWPKSISEASIYFTLQPRILDEMRGRQGLSLGQEPGAATEIEAMQGC